MRASCILILFICFNSVIGNSQTNSTLILSAITDSYVNSNDAGSTFEGEGKLYIGVQSSSVKRTFLNFDISSLPINATILSAELRINIDLEEDGIHNERLQLQKVIEYWDVNSLSFENQPRTQLEDQVVESQIVSGYRVFNVTEHVFTWLNGAENFGWMLGAKDERIDGESSYFAKEAGENEPILFIEYFLPFEFVSASIEHAGSSTLLNGSITTNISGGSPNLTYTWYNGLTGNIIAGASSNIISNLGYGWYGLKIQDSQGSPAYMAFIVGAKGESKNISFAPDLNYIDDANLVDGPINNGSSAGVYNRSNYGRANTLNIRDWDNIREKTVIKFRLWADSRLEFEKADFELKGNSHVNNSYGNGLNISLITSDWSENSVTWNTTPEYSNSIVNFVSQSTTNTENKIIDLVAYWEFWKRHNESNNGVLIEIPDMNLSRRRMFFYSSDNTNASLRPKIEFTVKVQKAIISNYDEQTELGQIEINLNEVSNKVGPFYYRFSTLPIMNLIEEFNLIKDSLYNGELDSSRFFVGESSVNRVYDQLPLGKYYVSVFDNNKSLIVNEEITIGGNIELKENDGIILSKNKLKSILPNSSALINVFVNDQSNSTLAFEPIDKTNKQIYGFVNSSTSTCAVISDFSFGMLIENNELTVIENGESVLTMPIIENKLELLFEKGVVSYKVGESTVHSANLSEESIYRGGAYILLANQVTKFDFINLTRKRFNLNIKDVQHHKCSGQAGGFKFYVRPSYLPMSYNSVKHQTSYLMTQFDYSWTIKKDGNIVQQGNSGVQLAPFNPVINNFSSSISGPGIYTIVIQVNIYYGSIPNAVIDIETTTKTIVVGYEADWTDVNRYSTPGDMSIIRNTNVPGTYAFARSKNYLTNGNSGWVTFTPQLLNSFFQQNLLRLSTNSGMNSTPDFSDLYGITFARFANNSLLIVNNQMGSSFTSTPVWFATNAEIKLQITNTPGSSKVKVYANNVYLTEFNRPPGSIILRGNSKVLNNGFKDVITSFGCSSPTDRIYAKLERTLDGVLYHSHGAVLSFYFDEEYEDSSPSLNYKVWSYSNPLQSIPTGNGFINLVKVFGDNRYELNVSALNSNTVYVLEIKNSKDEVFYLRFMRDKSTTILYPTSPTLITE